MGTKINSKVRFSIVILTFNRIKLLKQCVESIISLDYPKKDYEIIIVDDASKDPTKEYIKNKINSIEKKSNESHYPLIKYYRHAHNRGVSASRNTGIKNSAMDYICFVADDYILPKDYLKYADNFFKKNRHAKALRSRIVNIDKKNYFAIINFLYLNRHIMENIDKNIEYPAPVNLPASGAAIFNKNIFRKIGLFNEKLRGGEDSDLSRRMRHNEIKLYFNPEKEILAYFPDTLTSSLKNKFSYGMSYFNFYNKGCGYKSMLNNFRVRLKISIRDTIKSVEHLSRKEKAFYLPGVFTLELTHLIGWVWEGFHSARL